jgi:TPR repeat protein
MNSYTPKEKVPDTGCLFYIVALLVAFVAALLIAVIVDEWFPTYGATVGNVAFFFGILGIIQAETYLRKKRELRHWIKNEYPEWAREAEMGDPQVQYNLGWAIFMRCCGKECVPASFWMLKAAEKGHREAQEFLAAHYRWGHEVPVDLEKAAYWYRKAADNGAVHAQLQLGKLYFSGLGVPEDMKEAVSWYLKASRHGSGKWNINFATPEAQQWLGRCYYFAWGVEEDHVEAYAYYSLAGVKNENDRKIFTALEEQLTVSEIEAGKRRANEIRKEITARARAED